MNHERDPERNKIVVIRHAKSSWDDPSLVDHDRPLSKRGHKALPRLRDHIEALQLHPDLVLYSSSRRTTETLDGIRDVLGRRARTTKDRALYGATVEQLLGVLRRLDAQVITLLLIGHNPGVADLVDLLADSSTIGNPAVNVFPTAAMAVLSVARPWSALQPSCAVLENFWTPRQK